MPDAQPPIPLTLGRRQWGQWAAATALSGFAGSALAQETKYPGKALRMVIPFTPGGSADILGRAIGHELTTAWGQSVVPENVAGAGGSIGAVALCLLGKKLGGGLLPDVEHGSCLC